MYGLCKAKHCYCGEHVNKDSQPITVLHELSLLLPAGAVVCVAYEKRSNSSVMETRHLRLHVSYLQVKSTYGGVICSYGVIMASLAAVHAHCIYIKAAC